MCHRNLSIYFGILLHIIHYSLHCRYLANATLDNLSEEMLQDWKRRLSSDTELQKSIQDRQSLPVHAMKATIMEAINEHPVIIIRGNTGCGK